jgi:hypothetical protein
MAKKLLETSLGHWDDTWFSLNGRRISNEDALKLIGEKCNPYLTKDKGGVVVYFSEEEYKKLKEDSMFRLEE